MSCKVDVNTLGSYQTVQYNRLTDTLILSVLSPSTWGQCSYIITLFIITYVFCIFECLWAPRKMGKCSLGLPSLNKDFIIIIIQIRAAIYRLPVVL